MDVDERQKLIEDEYHIAMTDEIVKDVKIVCNYSEAIERIGREAGLLAGMERGRQEGRQEGLQEGLQQGRQEGRQEGKNQTLGLLARLKKELKARGRESEFDSALDDPTVFNTLIAEFRLS